MVKRVQVILDYDIEYKDADGLDDALDSLTQSYSRNQGRSEDITAAWYSIRCVCNKPIIKRFKARVKRRNCEIYHSED